MIPLQLNEHAVGIILKELVRRAMVVIRAKRFSHEATPKEGYSGSMDDVLTDADMAAQAIFEKSIRETMPGVGILGEEGLRVACTLPGCDVYVTVDPLDGTKAFVRKQSHGVGTMVAVVMDGEVVSAWIGDVNTLEIFGFRARSDRVHRISQLEVSDRLDIIPRRVRLADKYLLLRDLPDQDCAYVWELLPRFRSAEVSGGSIGVWYTRLWTYEVGGTLLPPGKETPWDTTPVIGISRKLGFVFMRPGASGWEEYEPEIPRNVIPRDHYTLVVHESVVDQLKI